MGYNLYIGELTTEIEASPGEHVFCNFGVKSKTDKNAPLNSSHLYTNECWPSYSGWSAFCRRTGLYSLFFKEYEGILANHPGAYVLTENDLTDFEQAKNSYLESGNQIDVYDNRRLNWLCYWTKWALANCKVPAFVNS